jgi:hypothetical protein
VSLQGGNGSRASVVYLLQHRNTTDRLTFAGRPDRRVASARGFRSRNPLLPLHALSWAVGRRLGGLQDLTLPPQT